VCPPDPFARLGDPAPDCVRVLRVGAGWGGVIVTICLSKVRMSALG